MRLIYVAFIILLVVMTSAQCQETAKEVNIKDETTNARTHTSLFQYQETAKEWNIKGYVLYMQSKYDEAIEAYDEAVRLDPNYADAWLHKGMALDEQGKYDDAIQAYDEALRLNSSHAYARNFKGSALYKQGKYEEAIEAYDEAIRLNSSDSGAWIKKGDALAKQSKYDEAIEAYDEAIRLDPNSESVWIGKGEALDEQGKYDEAIQAYDEALRLYPDDVYVWNKKGYALKALEKTAEANAAFAKAKELESPSYHAPVSAANSDEARSPQSEPTSMAGALRLSDMNEMQLYENAQHGFELSHPMNWIVQEPDANDQGIVVGFLAPGEDVNNPATYLFVQIEKLPSGQKITLEQYGQAVQRNLKAAMPDLKVLTESDISIGLQPGHAIVYELASQDATFRVLKAWTLRGENAYAFTYNAPNDRYNKFAGDISKMIGSLNGA